MVFRNVTLVFWVGCGLSLPAFGEVRITGLAGEEAVISNPPGDWHSGAGARYALDGFTGGMDAGTPGDGWGYRLFGGSNLERDDNELAIPVAIKKGTGSFTVALDVLGIKDAKTPLLVFLNDRKAGEMTLAGEAGAHVTGEIQVHPDGQTGFSLVRIVNPTPELAVLVDAVTIREAGVRPALAMQAVEADGKTYVVRKPVSADGRFQLWQFGRYLKGGAERRSFDREEFRMRYERIKQSGHRQIGQSDDSLHVLYPVERDTEGRQLENWALMGRTFFGDLEANCPIRGFQIAFESPATGTGRLVLHALPNALSSSMIVCVNGDKNRARIGTGQKGIPGPGGLLFDNDPKVQAQTDIQPGKIIIYDNIPVKAGRNTIDFDYEGVGFLWPAKTYKAVSANFDYITFDLKPRELKPSGADRRFAEPPLAGPAVTEPAAVTVDLGTRWTVRGKSAIPKGLFSLTTYKGGAGLTTPESWQPLRKINIGCVNGGIHPSLTLPDPADAQGRQAAWENFATRWVASPAWKPDAASKPIVLARQYGIDFHVAPHLAGWGMFPLWANRIPVDIPAWSGDMTDLVRIMKTRTPELEYLNFLHEAEPMLQHSHLLRGADATTVSGAEYGGLMDRTAMAKIHREFPDLKLIGPNQWGPPFSGPGGMDFLGNRFEEWTRPYLELAWNELYAFNSHNYALDYTRCNTGELQTLVNFMRVRFGEEKPIFMNEGHIGGFEWTPWVKYDDRALWLYDGYPILRALFYGVANLDKLQVMSWHDYGAWPTEEWATHRDVAAGLPAAKPRPDLANDTPMPLWTALWLFRELRGDTLAVQAGAETQAVASFDGNGYSAVILNASLASREMTVDFTLPAGRKIQAVRVEFMEAGTDYYRFDAGVLAADRWRQAGHGVVIQARPLAGYHVRVILDRPAPPARAAGLDQYFGDQVFVELNRYAPEGRITIKCPKPTSQAKQARLCLAYESMLLEPEEVAFTFNGKPIQADRPNYLEVPLAMKEIKATNTLTFSLRDKATRNYFRVRSASLIIRN